MGELLQQLKELCIRQDALLTEAELQIKQIKSLTQ